MDGGESINHHLLMQALEVAGREASPSAGVIDSHSTEAGGPRGFDAGKKIKGRKRHILTDTSGLLVGAVVHAAEIAFPWLRHVFADGGYAGEKLEQSLVPLGNWTIDIVKRSDIAKGFVLLPRRWVVERTLARINRNRRLAKDFEKSITTAVAWIMIASVKLITRRLTRA